MSLQVEVMAPLLQVFDMPTSLAFYRDLLGFERVDDSDAGDASDWVWLRLHGVDLMLNTAYESDSRPPAPDRHASLRTRTPACSSVAATSTARTRVFWPTA